MYGLCGIRSEWTQTFFSTVLPWSWEGRLRLAAVPVAAGAPGFREVQGDRCKEWAGQVATAWSFWHSPWRPVVKRHHGCVCYHGCSTAGFSLGEQIQAAASRTPRPSEEKQPLPFINSINSQHMSFFGRRTLFGFQAFFRQTFACTCQQFSIYFLIVP